MFAYMPDVKTEKSYYPNGQLRGECHLFDGKPVGVTKLWHENGVLSWECPFEKGLENGLIRQWNKEGKLLGECRMVHGTGTNKSWHENGQLEREVSSINGRLCGRFRCWDEDGKPVSTSFYIMDKKVSKQKYVAACQANPNLPCYEDGNLKPEEPKIAETYQKQETPMSEWDRHKHDEFIKKFLLKPNRGEARQWLKGGEGRFIGELTHEDSVEFVEDGYKAGATKIIAVEIEEETTNCLIAYLPPAGSKREQVFRWNSEFALKSGFDPYDDWGQNELFVFFD